VVDPDSHPIPRVGWYSRSGSTRHPPLTAYGTLTPSGRPFQWRSAQRGHPGERSVPRSLPVVLPPNSSAHRLDTLPGFGLLPFRSPLLRESSLFLEVLRCFSSPGSLPTSSGDGPSRPPGCPIRRPLDHRVPAPPQSVSPRGCVLPRQQAPRHPPSALFCTWSSNHHRWSVSVRLRPPRGLPVLRSPSSSGSKHAQVHMYRSSLLGFVSSRSPGRPARSPTCSPCLALSPDSTPQVLAPFAVSPHRSSVELARRGGRIRPGWPNQSNCQGARSPRRRGNRSDPERG
jgi:hypothetical protein